MRVLLAEDNVVNQEVALAMFEMLGATLDVVPDGRQAVAAALALPYDLIFMDCQMPEVDGFAAVRLIREKERGDSPEARANGGPRERRVIIALTAHAGKEDRERCLASGMDDYLAKPFSRDQLLAVVTRWLPAAGRRGHRPAGGAATDGGAVPHSAPASTPRASAAADAGEEPAVDPAALERILSLQRPGSPGLLERIAGLYFTNTPKLLAAMETAIARADREALRHAAHTLKSTSATLGAARLAQLCRETEEAARNGTAIAEPRVLDAMHAEYERVRRGLLGALEARP
jgi:CheY-like chemotaxis protein/HPt (histidine-containing phosphotransfer) domain-containing protein